jgi:uncharacterized protein (TIGR03435 family)
MKHVITGCCLSILSANLLVGQTAPPAPAFELADIHVSAPGTALKLQHLPGRLEIHGATMLDLIAEAWQVDRSIIVGGPSWLNTDKFDVIAKAPSGSSPAAIQEMLRNLLADRFKLVARSDNHDSPVYLLTVGPKGPKMDPAAGRGRSIVNRVPGNPPLDNHVLYQNTTMADLAKSVATQARFFIDRPLIDETGLKEAFDFELEWTSLPAYNRAKASANAPPPVGLFEALEKIGLKLTPADRPQPALRVDSVNEIPIPNPPGSTIPAPSYPTDFEHAEVRTAKPLRAIVGPVGPTAIQNGQVEITGATLKWLISFAFDTTPNHISGAAKWMEEDRFDVSARARSTAPIEAVQVMMKNLLIQRFRMVTHMEDQPEPGYSLLAGEKVKLKESDGTARSGCTMATIRNRHIDTCRNTTMAQFCERLLNDANLYIHPPLIDMTGLKGGYDFVLSWTPRNLLAGGPADAAPDGSPLTHTDDLTVFDAIKQQLGLKLEEQKHPVPLLVVDHANQTPSDK